MLIKLQFTNPDFPEQRLVTFRKGGKYEGILFPGSVIALTGMSSSQKFARGATVNGIMRYDKISDVPGSILSAAQNPACMTWVGLLNKMQRWYGSYKNEDGVAVIWFTPLLQPARAGISPID